jgi:hypothetical protein
MQKGAYVMKEFKKFHNKTNCERRIRKVEIRELSEVFTTV